MTREVPLTDEQRMWLRANALLPTVFLLATLLLLAGMVALIAGPILPHPLGRIFVAVVALLLVGVCIAVAIHVRNNRADLRRGTASVARARLQRKERSGRAPYTFYAVFDGVGRVIVMGDVYERLVEGRTFEVTFSPRTRKAWSISP
ncbi:MAG TPA: hypothetical protein VHW00_05285 [Thermoanaerobaculia bacterium]|nr:hypothetical protein [Thermoanaerobaculia bacterium]